MAPTATSTPQQQTDTPVVKGDGAADASTPTGSVIMHVASDGSNAAAAVGGTERVKSLAGTSGKHSSGRYSDASAPRSLPRCGEEDANFLSFAYLWWLNPLFALGGRRTIEESDVPQVRSDVAAEYTANLFQEKWNIEKKRYDEEERQAEEERMKSNPSASGDMDGVASDPSTPAKKLSLNLSATEQINFASYRLLFRTLNSMYGTRFWLAGLFKAAYDATSFAQPMLLKAFIKFISNSQKEDREPPPAWEGYTIAAGMFLATLVGIVMLNLFQRTVYGVGLRARTALITALYRKSFRLSPAARSQLSVGQQINMMSVDATMVDQACVWLHYGWSALAQVIVAIALLLDALGPPALVGVGIVLIFMPMQTAVMRGMRLARRSALKYTDQRIRMLSEILQGIRVIKVYAWESSFMKQLSLLRVQEMKWVRTAAFIRGRNSCVIQLGPILMALGSFIVLGATGGSIDAANIFSSVVLFNLLRMPLMQVPTVLNWIADAQIGLNRIQKYLLAEELTHQPDRLTPEEAAEATARDRKDIEEGNAEPELKKAYESLMKAVAKDANTGAGPNDDRYAIRMHKAEFSWDILPEQIVKDDPAELAAAASGGGGRGGGRGGVGRGGGGGGGGGGKKPTGDVAFQPLTDSEPKVAPSVLHDITLLIPAGKLTIICGAVGAGKSSLLFGLLGEMKKKSGSVSIAGSVGFCAQQAWIQNSNVRNNILFGQPYDQQRYEETIRVCALTRDLKVLPDGDLTEIGEKGINLSGGQKQRVNLGRAYYFNSDIILMDDPLSAVDAHVSKYLFTECIQGAMSGKTRLLVTHQLQYLPYADCVIFLKDGRVAEMGPFATLMEDEGEFAKLFRTHGGGDNSQEGEGEEKEEEADDEPIIGTEKKQEQAELAADAAAGASKKKKGGGVRALMTTEERAQGTLAWETWWYYLEAFGGVFWVTIILFTVSMQMGIRIYNDYWLSGWTDDTYNRSNYFYIAIYGALGFALCVATFANIMLQVQRGYKASISIHDRCFESLLRAPLSFFDTTPIGRVLNRFSRDQDVIDNNLSDSLRQLNTLSFSIAGVLIMMCIVQPWFILAIIPICYLNWHFQNVYRRVNREVKRMDSTSRSPLFAHYSETLTGLPTIRAYRQQQPFIGTNGARMDENNRFYFLLAASQRWLGTRLETMGGLVVFSTAIIAAANADSIESGLAGLSLSYAMQVTQQLSFFLRQSVESENYMNSVERSKHYAALDREAPPTLPDDSALQESQWPTRGHIRFENVSMRYRPGLPLVLNAVNIDIPGGARVGIVGRTGAGKSSLMVSLFRLVEVCGGRILIDGADIASIGLDKLRRSMAIIPQDAQLFCGTIRSNLDPFDEYTDDAIWSVLKKGHLYDRIVRLEGGLLATVSENGDNFSVGEKCLICLSRAMLKDAKILIMDEATASVDMQTDALIQQSLRTHFNQCTILTIAHRLATIMDYDHCMVLDFGQIKEFDTPANLLRQAGNIFSGLVNETGPQTSELLRKLAFDAESVSQQRAAGVISPNTAASAKERLIQATLPIERESSTTRNRRAIADRLMASEYDAAAADGGDPVAAVLADPDSDLALEQSMVRWNEEEADSESEPNNDDERQVNHTASLLSEDDDNAGQMQVAINFHST